MFGTQKKVNTMVPPKWWRSDGGSVTAKLHQTDAHLVLADDHANPERMLVVTLNPAKGEGQRWHVFWKITHGSSVESNWDRGSRTLCDGQLEALFGLAESVLGPQENPEMGRLAVEEERGIYIREHGWVSVPGPAFPGYASSTFSFHATRSMQELVRELFMRARRS